MNSRFTTDRQRQTDRDTTLLRQPDRHPPKPTGYGVLTADITIDPLVGTLRAGTVVELHGDRIGGTLCGSWTRRTVERDGVLVDALTVVAPWHPEVVEMVVSPFTDELIPATSGTARRYAKQAEMEMVR